MLHVNSLFDSKFKRNTDDSYKYLLPTKSNVSKAKSNAFSKASSRSPLELLKAELKHLGPDHTGKSSYYVRGTSHIVDPSLRKNVVDTNHPLANLELKPTDIDMLKPLVYGSQYNWQKDPNPFYAPWNPPKLRRADEEGANTPSKPTSEASSSSIIGRFKNAIKHPKRTSKNRSMFDCSDIRFDFDKIHNPDDIGSVPLQDLQDLEDASVSRHDSVSSSSTKRKALLKTQEEKPNLVETVYKPFRKSKFLDSPHQMTFFVLKGKPILTAPLSFLGNTFMGTKKLLAQAADNPIYKKLGIHRYEVSMEGFRDEQISFEIHEKRVSVTGRTPISPRNPMTKREVVEVFQLAPFLNMNRMRIHRNKIGRIIFEEKWKDDESSDEESNPMRRNSRKFKRKY